MQGIERETGEHKLKLLKQEIKHIIKKLVDLNNFVFADTLLPCGTIRKPNAHSGRFGFLPTHKPK